MGNSVFLLDLPRLSPNSPARPGHFGVGLARALTELGVPAEHWRAGLLATDTARADDFGLRIVLSVPGLYALGKPSWHDDVGHSDLARAVRELGLAALPGELVFTEAQGSSIGDLAENENDLCVGRSRTG